MFVAKYSSSGAYQWARHYGGSGFIKPQAVAVDASGNIFVTGAFNGTVNFGGGSVTSAYGIEDIFVAKYSSSGTYQWSKIIACANTNASGYGVAVDSGGNVIVTGDFLAYVNFGGTDLVGYGSHNIFVAKYSSSGAHLWSKAFGNGTEDLPYAIAVDGNDNIVLTGYFHDDMDFGGGTLFSEGYADVFVIKFSSSGAHLWSRSFGGASSDIGYGVAVDGSNNVVLTGSFMGTVDFGGGSQSSSGSMDVFVVKYSSTGSFLWSRSAGGTSVDQGRSVAVDSSGNVVVTGQFYGTADFGGGSIAGGGGLDIFVAKYGSSGAHQWSAAFGGTSTDDGQAVAVNSAGEAIVTGFFYGTADFGGLVLTGSWSDIFLMSLAP